ncbi:MAG: HEAT repeat domain-containing protein, partial [Candidatus Heimdallarchaeota archaeon]|nr:HEAT repeat domain-containing protein [Candidatus Heimdallarchaeota archaeon]
ALGEIGSDSAVFHLIPLLSDPDLLVQVSAAVAFGKIGSDSAVSHLIPLLSDSNILVSVFATVALGQIGSDSVVSSLIPLLSDPNTSVSTLASVALGQIGSDSAVSSLVPLLSDPDTSVRNGVAFALGKIGSDSSVSALLDSLSDTYFGMRMKAAFALGEIGSDSAVSALLDSLSDTYFGVRMNAAFALGEIGSDSAVSPLVPLLSDSLASVRMNAVMSLGKIGSVSVVPSLIPLLSDPDASVRAMAASAFYDIGSDSAVSALLDSLYDSNAKVREKASFALKKICKIKHKDLLVKLTKSDHEDAVNSGYEILTKFERDELSEQELFRDIQKIPEKVTSSGKHGFPDAHSPEGGKTDAYIGILVDKLKSISEPITLVDYGCGKGKLLSAMEGLPLSARKYISYIGVDVRTEYLYRTELFARKKGYYDSLKTIPEFLHPEMFNSKDFLVDYVFVVHTLHEIELVNLIDTIYHISDKLNAGGQIFVLDQSQLIEPESNYTLWDSNDFETLYSDSGFKVSSMARDTKTEKKLVSVEIEKVEDNYFSIEKVKENCLSVYESKQDTILKQINFVEYGCTEYNSFCEQYTILGGQIKKVKDLNIR